MNENDFDGLPENDWDDSWEFAWSEFDWERHLRDQDSRIQAYLSNYEKAGDRPDRIDEVAHQMGWDQEGWTNDDPEMAEPPADEVGTSQAPVAGFAGSDGESVDPYTIHKHPVYVSTRALFLWLQRSWEFVAPACGSRMPVRVAVAFATSLARAEHAGLLAAHALDMGDFSLAVCEVKRAMVELNAALRNLQAVDAAAHPAFSQFRHQATLRIFDVREIWLRVMRDCREELDRRVSEEEN
jgi:hypothetical protein